MDTKVVAICGSMKFAKEMIEYTKELETQYGWCVIQCVYELDPTKISTEELDRVVSAHWKKIDICDAIFVVNVGGYIGASTQKEIDYAKSLGKEVIFAFNLKDTKSFDKMF